MAAVTVLDRGKKPMLSAPDESFSSPVLGSSCVSVSSPVRCLGPSHDQFGIYSRRSWACRDLLSSVVVVHYGPILANVLGCGNIAGVVPPPSAFS